MITTSDSDYANDLRVAIYLEIGWSDYLLPTRGDVTRPKMSSYPNPLLDYVKPTFYEEAAKFAIGCVGNSRSQPETFCDIGGGPGRTVFEIGTQFPDLKNLVLVEPSARFCEWANRLLLHSEDCLPVIPVLHTAGIPDWISPMSRPPTLEMAADRIEIVNSTLEGFQTEQRFDLVSCLNVVDRHPLPCSVIDRIGHLMKDKGTLILSSPMDFQIEDTPEKKNWIADLQVLFSKDSAWSCVDQSELFYDYRTSDRSWTRLCSQIIGMQYH